jgi:hypothetical protein|tara:strand:+ start:13 stop:261 length:249 start_codon:yes stop_codon:yes gene_type:complete
MKYGVIIYEGKKIIDQRTVETKDEKTLDKIIGSKTHRFWNGGDWTEPRFIIKVTAIGESNERHIGTITNFCNRPTSVAVQGV